MVAGTIVATWIRDDVNHTGESSVTEQEWPATGNALNGSMFGGSGSGQFVQEPAQRQSFRPNFSRSRNLSNKRSNFLMLRAFQEAVGDSWRSAVRVSVGGQQVALGAIVGSDGWVLTKSSELTTHDQVDCELYDNRVLTGEVVTRIPEHDVALVRLNAANLPVVVWEESLPAQGNWLATLDLKTTPRSVGVVSAGTQRVRSSSPVLGVHLTDSSKGAAVTRVLSGTGADEAGLRVGDSIYQVNGMDVRSLRGFRSAIGSARGGDSVSLAVDRAEKQFEVQARLMDLSDELLDDTEMEVNGAISARSTGFERVFLHDTVLEPHHCGGPVVNLDGRVVGINIARAGRVTSYAIPTDVIRPIVDGIIEQARLVSRNSQALPPIDAVR